LPIYPLLAPVIGADAMRCVDGYQHYDDHTDPISTTRRRFRADLLEESIDTGGTLQRPAMRITGPALDAADPIGLAKFYERLLGWEMVELEGPRPGYPPTDGWAKLRSPTGDMKMEFQYEQHYVPPTWPASVGEQQMMMHLDIGVADLEDGIAWALAAGATIAEHQPQRDVRVMLDPAGHPFCLFATRFSA